MKFTGMRAALPRLRQIEEQIDRGTASDAFEVVRIAVKDERDPMQLAIPRCNGMTPKGARDPLHGRMDFKPGARAGEAVEVQRRQRQPAKANSLCQCRLLWAGGGFARRSGGGYPRDADQHNAIQKRLPISFLRWFL